MPRFTSTGLPPEPMAFIPSLGTALSSAAPEEGGLAAGIVNTSYQIGSALGLAEMTAVAAAFGADRPAAVCRELTKLHEEVRRGTLAELAAWAAEGVRGEIAIVVGGASAREVAFPDAVTQVLELVRDGARLKAAAAEVAALTGHSSRELYQAALAVKG